jgi:hypothetical protein
MSTPPAPPTPTHDAPPRVAPRANQCPGCTGPVDPADVFCPSCGHALSPSPVDPTVTQSPLTRAFRCESCGAQVHCEADARSTTCPFCAAPYVLEIAPELSGRQDPEFVLGFAVPPDEADRIYRQWVRRGGWFRPGDLAARARAEGLRGIYLPFWSFSCRADSEWSAEIGEYWYRTETYTTRDANGKLVTRTRQVRETEWWSLSGGHHAYHSFYLVSGSKGLKQEFFERVLPFQLLALKRYAPRYLAGWLSEDYSIEKEAAYPLSEAEFRRREQAAIAAMLPGDTYRSLETRTRFSRVNSDLILLPIYLRTYRYKDQVYRTVINGQTGRIWGQKPLSGVRIGGLVGAILLVIVIVWLLITLLSR